VGVDGLEQPAPVPSLPVTRQHGDLTEPDQQLGAAIHLVRVRARVRVRVRISQGGG